MPKPGCGAAGRRPCCRRSGGPSVEPAVLAALLVAEGYGYDLRRTIAEMTGGELEADAGGLYRALRRLEEEGSVASRWSEDEAAGPRRREYELTAQGVDLARQWLVALRQRERMDRMLAEMLEGGLEQAGLYDEAAPCGGCTRAQAQPGA